MGMIADEILIAEYETPHDKECLNRYSGFFAVYAAYMLGCGATCIRIKKNLRRMANSVGLHLDMIILSHHVTVVLTDNSTGIQSRYIREIEKIGISFEINTRLSELSWKVAEGKISIDEAEIMFFRIVKTRPMTDSRILILVVIANASFCHLFGGDWGAMVIVAISTFLGYSMKIFLSSKKWESTLIWISCSFLSALTAAGLTYLPLTSTPDWAISASVLYLIPGIPYINSISDCLDGHYLCAFGRFIHAFALTVCIAIGLTAGILLADKSLIL